MSMIGPSGSIAALGTSLLYLGRLLALLSIMADGRGEIPAGGLRCCTLSDDEMRHLVSLAQPG